MDRLLVNSLLDTIEQPAILVNGNYELVATNAAYRKRYQFDPEKSPLRHCYQISHNFQQPCDKEGEHCPLQTARISGKPARAMHLHVTPEGREHIDVHLEPIFDDSGKLTYFLETLHDINKSGKTPGMARTTLKGESPAFNQHLLQLTRAATGTISVLLLGESGTGKELAARFLHENSKRRHRPFITVECTGLSDNIFESELFGHVKGSFTGAINNKTGLIAAAEGGTLFLDEVGDIPLSQQVKLLRLLETGMYRPVGSVELHYSDFRLVCATNKNLAQMVKEGLFRRDLFYRINSFPVHLPALRERGADIGLLAQDILSECCDNLLVHFSDAALRYLESYSFPGNIRELKNMIERASLLRNGPRIEVEDLVQQEQAEQAAASSHREIIPLDQLEQRYLQDIHASFDGNNAELASKLGISERTLYRKLRQLA